MYQALKETEFIQKFGEQAYQDILKNSIDFLMKTPEYKNDQPYCHGLAMFDWTDYGFKNLVVEINCKKDGPIKDFGIVAFAVTDEDAPNEFLDRFNEMRKLGEYSTSERKN